MENTNFLLSTLQKYNIKRSDVLGFDYTSEKYITVEDLIKEYNALKKEQQIILPRTFIKRVKDQKDLINNLFDMYNFIKRVNRYFTEGGK